LLLDPDTSNEGEKFRPLWPPRKVVAWAIFPFRELTPGDEMPLIENMPAATRVGDDFRSPSLLINADWMTKMQIKMMAVRMLNHQSMRLSNSDEATPQRQTKQESFTKQHQ
jgi:hypothetical protein